MSRLSKVDMVIPLIIIAGTGRNSGKTTLICKIVELLKTEKNIVAIKITNHFHNSNNYDPFYEKAGIKIFEEINPTETKDTYRMLMAGANKVFYVECESSKTSEAFKIVKNYCNDTELIICESGGLIQYVQPEIFIIAKNDSPKANSMKYIESADFVLEFNEIINISNTKLYNLIAKFILLKDKAI